MMIFHKEMFYLYEAAVIVIVVVVIVVAAGFNANEMNSDNLTFQLTLIQMSNAKRYHF